MTEVSQLIVESLESTKCGKWESTKFGKCKVDNGPPPPQSIGFKRREIISELRVLIEIFIGLNIPSR